MKHLPLDNLESALGHQFANRGLLQQALTHSSFARESAEAAEDNEQLEFLGDAVLQLVASQELFQRFPAYQEGELSKLRAHLVNANHLVHCAQKLQLGSYLRLGRGEEKTGGRRKTALLADAVEALLAASIWMADSSWRAPLCFPIFWNRSWIGSPAPAARCSS